MFEFVKNPTPGRCPVKWCRKPGRQGRTLCAKHTKQKYRANNPAKAAYDTLRHNAKRRRKIFDLTYEEFLMFIEATAYLDNKGRTKHCYHIDRIDPAKGYTLSNIRVLTCSENTVKGNQERQPECPF
jgi:hypothetical protein